MVNFLLHVITCDVILCSALPLAAWSVDTYPRKTLAIVLKKLDFPAPTGPMMRIFDCLACTNWGGENVSTSILSSCSNYNISNIQYIY